MTVLPATIRSAWETRQGPIVLATVDAQGIPNIIYATCVKMYDEGLLVVADNFFSKTRANILAGSQGSLLFITDEGKAYQLKGTIAYETEGAYFDDMKTWLDAKLPGHAAAVLQVQEAYSGATKLL